MIWQEMLLAGAAFGLGIALLVHALVPSAPDLGAALDTLQERTPMPLAASARGDDEEPADARERIGRFLGKRLGHLPVLRVADKDLEVLGHSNNWLLGQKALFALLGLATPGVLWAVLSMILPVPVALPLLVSVLAAGFMWWLPDLDVAQRADAARHEFAFAVMAYVDLVALERAAGSGIVQSLERAAHAGDTWVFRRISEVLDLARLSGQAPWGALEDLADRLSLGNLRELASIARVSGEYDSSVYDNLRARSAAMRHTLQTQDQARANAASERMLAPVSMLGLIFMFLLAYPALQAITG